MSDESLININESTPDSLPSDVTTENPSLIAAQLESLLSDLNSIYQDIGYSKDDILQREKLIFNSISNSISDFHNDAINEREKLTVENQNTVILVNKLLQIIGDESGSSIPDIYVRSLLSSSKPISLVSMNKNLAVAKEYVAKSYSKQLKEYLELSLRLGILAEKIDLDQGTEVLTVVPRVPVCVDMLKKLETADIYEYIAENEKVLLQSVNFKDLSKVFLSKVETEIKGFEFEMNQRFSALKKLAIDVQALENVLGIQDSGLTSIIQSTSPDEVNLDYSFIVDLRSKLNDYEELRIQRMKEKELLISQCEVLWAKLKEDPQTVEQFRNQNSSLSETAISNYMIELQRLEVNKKKFIKTLIHDSQEKVISLWDQLHFSSQEREYFQVHFQCTEYDDILLDKFEAEILALQEKFEVYKPILLLVDEFYALQQDKISLEESSRDSSRLLARNSHKILMEEERQRKRISRHFPRVIDDLKLRLGEFEVKFGHPFLVEGKEFLSIVNEQEQELGVKFPRRRMVTSRPAQSVNQHTKAPTNKPQSTSRSLSASKVQKPNHKPITRQVVSDTPVRRVPEKVASTLRLASNARPARQPTTSTVASRISIAIHRPVRSNTMPGARSIPRPLPRTSSTGSNGTHDRYNGSTRLFSPQRQASRLPQPKFELPKPRNILGNIVNESQSIDRLGKPPALIPGKENQENSDDDSMIAFDKWRTEQLQKLEDKPTAINWEDDVF